jgi:tRNA modification GTPase
MQQQQQQRRQVWQLWLIVMLLAMLNSNGLRWARTLSSTASRMVDSRRRQSMSSVAASDTIYALSSGKASHSGVAVVRVSGPSAWEVLTSLCGGPEAVKLLQPRYATVKSLKCPKTGEKLDSALVLWFPGPRSFTGEDVVEFHLHGSRAVLAGVFAAMEHLDKTKNLDIRPAEKGDFTKRAFDNGKMDLTEVEGLADLLVAETAVQRLQALRQMDGHMRKNYEIWREQLLKCLAHTEAVIDFGDDDREGDINDHAMDPLIPIVRNLRNELSRHLQDGRKGEIIREGVQVVLIGQPNAGKSSLMNILARRPAAIVSPIAGTTRCVILTVSRIDIIVVDTM